MSNAEQRISTVDPSPLSAAICNIQAAKIDIEDQPSQNNLRFSEWSEGKNPPTPFALPYGIDEDARGPIPFLPYLPKSLQDPSLAPSVGKGGGPRGILFWDRDAALQKAQNLPDLNIKTKKSSPFSFIFLLQCNKEQQFRGKSSVRDKHLPYRLLYHARLCVVNEGKAQIFAMTWLLGKIRRIFNHVCYFLCFCAKAVEDGWPLF